MKTVLITGGRGFLGRNLVAHLRERKDCTTVIYDHSDPPQQLKESVLSADIIFHLAGVNRPQDPTEFHTVNTELTKQICQLLRDGCRHPKIVFSSSIQAELDNPYGASKAGAERALLEFSSETGSIVRIYRLKNLFGKWCRPNYNSVTATFCHNIANELPITISDPKREIELTYVDEVVSALLRELDEFRDSGLAGRELPFYAIQLGELAGRLQAFHEMRCSVTLPDFSDPFNRALYATYLSYVPVTQREYQLEIRSDPRGSLAEFIKQASFGQVFVSRTKPGITRGNHYHHTKTEKFLVVEGEGLIRMRPIEGRIVEEYSVTGSRYQVIDIPPGLTHSITNIGNREMVTLFWASEVFDPNRPDTFFLPVDLEVQQRVAALESA